MKKILKIVSVSALLAVTFSVSVFAAENKGWVKNDEGIWNYYDEEGNLVTDEWKKDGGKWYYLDDEGNMVVNNWVDEDTYVGADGTKATSTWVYSYGYDEEDDLDSDPSWFYFDTKGKKVTAGDRDYKSKTIDGKVYYFDQNGKMQYGWLQIDDTVYYLGSDMNGARTQSQWLWLEAPNSDAEEDGITINGHETDEEGSDIVCNEEGWYWFNANGKMNTKNQLKVNGKTYYFNAHGQMLYEWVNGLAASPSFTLDSEGHSAGITDIYYANIEEDGSRANGWYLIEGSVATGRDDETKWYWFKDGKAEHSDAVNTYLIKKLSWDGKSGKFAFDYKGEMQTGLVFNKGELYYFDENGYMKTGRIETSDDNGDDFTFGFTVKNSNNGKGYCGVKDDYLYEDGQLLKADDKYAVYYSKHNKNMYLVNKSGKIQKSKTKVYELDAGGYVVVNTSGIVKGYLDANEKPKADEVTDTMDASKIYVGGCTFDENLYDHEVAVAGTDVKGIFKGYYIELQ